MDIRIATPADCQAIADMASAFRNHLQRLAPTDAQFTESIARLLTSADSDFCIAMDEGTPVGYVLQRFRFSMWASGAEATIEDLFVDPAFRGKGAGRKLIEFALNRARARRCVTVCLDTNENNVASTRIYTQLGFDAVSKRWNGRQIFYRLKLEEPAEGKERA